MKNFNEIKLNGIQSFFAIMVIFLFVAFILSPIYSDGEPDIRLFLILWVLGLIFVVTSFIKLYQNWSRTYFDVKKEAVLDLIKNADRKIAVRSFSFSKQNNFKTLFSFDTNRCRLIFSKLYVGEDYIIFPLFNKAIFFDRNCRCEVKKSFACSNLIIEKNEKFYKFYIGSSKNLDYLKKWIERK